MLHVVIYVKYIQHRYIKLSIAIWSQIDNLKLDFAWIFKKFIFLDVYAVQSIVYTKNQRRLKIAQRVRVWVFSFFTGIYVNKRLNSSSVKFTFL